MLRMNSRWGVVMSVLVMVAGLAVTEEASAQQATRKATTHKGTAKRSLVKKSAPVPASAETQETVKQITRSAASQLVSPPPLQGPAGELARGDQRPAQLPAQSPISPTSGVPAASVTDSAADATGTAAGPEATAEASVPTVKSGPAATTAVVTQEALIEPSAVPPVEPNTPVIPAVGVPTMVLDGKGSSSAAAPGSLASTPTKPLAPKTSAVRRAVTAKTVGTTLAAAPTKASTSIVGATNRVTDRPDGSSRSVGKTSRTPVAKPMPVVSSGSGSASTSSAPSGATSTTGGTATKPAGAGTTTTASKTGAPVDGGTTTKPADGGTTGGTTVASGGATSSGTSTGSSGATSGSAGATAAPAAETFAVRPKALPSDPKSARFRALAWSPVSVDGVDFVAPFVWAGLPGSPVASDPAAIAQQLLQRPEGQRVLCFWDVLFELADHPLDRIQTPDGKPTEVRSPFMDHGIDATAQRVNAILAGIKRAGATVDVLVLDYERGFAWDPRFGSLDNDPRWIGLARELGFEDLRGMDAARIARWNEVMGRYIDDAIARSTDQPLQSVFPGARLANFDSFASTPMAPVIGADGAPFLRASVTDRNGTLVGLGSHDSSPFFGVLLPTTAQQRVDGVNPIGQDAFAAARLELHRSRAMRKPAGRSQMPWIAPKSLDAGAVVAKAEPGTAAPMRSTPYWDEMVLQLGLHGADDFLYWNPEGKLAPQAPVAALPEDHQALDGLLEELNRNLGQQPGDSMYREQPGFDDRVLATGRDDGESIVWRFTFDPGIESARVFFTDGTSVVVNREADRPGAWMAHPKSKSLVFDADNTAPVFEVVAARTSGTSSASAKSPDGSAAADSGDSTGTKDGADAGSTVASGGTSGSTGSTGDGSTLAIGEGGLGGDGAPSGVTPTELELLCDEALSFGGGTSLTTFSGSLRFTGTDWAGLFAAANSNPALADKIRRFVEYQRAALDAPRDRFVRPTRFEDIPSDMIDSIALRAGGNRDARALSMVDVTQTYFILSKMVPLAVAARYTGDQAMLSRIIDVLGEMRKYTPLQRPGWSLGSPSAVLGPNGDGPNMATAWGIIAIVDILSILGDSVPSELRATLRANLRQEVRDIAFAWAKRTPWYVQSRSVMSNQWTDPSAALVKACLFLGEDDLLPAYNLGVENLAATFRVAQADGAFLEGVTYAQMSGANLVSVVGDLNANGDARLASFPFVSRFWRWLLQMQLPGGYLVNCCDSNLSKLPSWAVSNPLSAQIAAVTAAGSSDAMSALRFAFPDGDPTLHGLRYAADALASSDLPRWTLPLHDFFPSQQLLVWRSEFEPAAQPQTAVGIWIKGGTMLEKSHGHRDQGQLSLHVGDRVVLMECGTPQDYGDPDLDTVFASAAGHNILQVGALEPRVLPADAPMTVTRLDDEGGRVTLDLKGAYTTANQVSRTIEWQRSGQVTIEDMAHLQFVASAETEFYRFHTGTSEPLSISGSGTAWRVEWGDAQASFECDVPIVIVQQTSRDNVKPPYRHQVIRVLAAGQTNRMLLKTTIRPTP